MMLTFDNLIDLIAQNFFSDGSPEMAALLLLVGMWAICAVICMNVKASPAWSIVPMIPLSMIFMGMNLLSPTVMIIIVIVSGAIVAAEFKKVVD